MDTEWKITRSQRVCSGCFADIPPDVDFYSCLREDPEEGLIRLDFCMQCWPEKCPHDAFSFWKTRIPSKPPSEHRLIDLDLILDFFAGMDGATEPDRLRLQFVTALYLMRRRVLRLIRTERQNGKEFLCFRCARLNKSFLVPNVNLDAEELERINEQLTDVLQKVVGEEESHASQKEAKAKSDDPQGTS